MSKPGLLTLTIKDKSALYLAYMPFIKNGGLFIPTNSSYKLGDEVFMLLNVMGEEEKIPVAGRVSMDYLAVNFGDLNPAAGDEVTLIGEENGNRITVEDLAAWAGTIPYEIATGFALNIPRLYL